MRLNEGQRALLGLVALVTFVAAVLYAIWWSWPLALAAGVPFLVAFLLLLTARSP